MCLLSLTGCQDNTQIIRSIKVQTGRADFAMQEAGFSGLLGALHHLEYTAPSKLTRYERWALSLASAELSGLSDPVCFGLELRPDQRALSFSTRRAGRVTRVWLQDCGQPIISTSLKLERSCQLAELELQSGCVLRFVREVLWPEMDRM